MKKYALIVAGGKGLRMGAELPKQFLPLGNGKPVLMYTLEAFHIYDPQIGIILVLPKEQQPFWIDLCKEHHFTLPHSVVSGGETRFHSVQNGLACIKDSESPVEENLSKEGHVKGDHTGNLLEESLISQSLVAVHDGVRPFVTTEVIARCYDAAAIYKAAIPVIEVVETMRQLTPAGSKTVNRDAYRLVQTPQVFDVGLLKKAYSQPYTPFFTDDASVVESIGVSVTLVQGNRENIKITTPFDLKIASTLI